MARDPDKLERETDQFMADLDDRVAAMRRYMRCANRLPEEGWAIGIRWYVTTKGMGLKYRYMLEELPPNGSRPLALPGSAESKEYAIVSIPSGHAKGDSGNFP